MTPPVPPPPAELMISDRELERRLHEQAPLPKNPQEPIPKTLVYQVGEPHREDHVLRGHAARPTDGKSASPGRAW